MSKTEMHADIAVSNPKSRSAWSGRVESDSKSSATGRPHLAVDVGVTGLKRDKVTVQLAIHSTDGVKTDPRIYYAWLRSGEHETRVGETEVGDWTDAPMDYTFPCTKQRKATMRLDDGSTIEITEDYETICEDTEHYYTRVSTLVFESEDVINPRDGAELELRDLGTNVKFRWEM